MDPLEPIWQDVPLDKLKEKIDFKDALIEQVNFLLQSTERYVSEEHLLEKKEQLRDERRQLWLEYSARKQWVDVQDGLKFAMC